MIGHGGIVPGRRSRTDAFALPGSLFRGRSNQAEPPPCEERPPARARPPRSRISGRSNHAERPCGCGGSPCTKSFRLIGTTGLRPSRAPSRRGSQRIQVRLGRGGGSAWLELPENRVGGRSLLRGCPSGLGGAWRGRRCRRSGRCRRCRRLGPKPPPAPGPRRWWAGRREGVRSRSRRRRGACRRRRGARPPRAAAARRSR